MKTLYIEVYKIEEWLPVEELQRIIFPNEQVPRGTYGFKGEIAEKEIRDKYIGKSVKKQMFLIASHIKPWAKSEPKEKADVDNGFLMCPNHDKLFDKGYISFDDEGKIIISERLPENENALILYPYIKDLTISHGRAAEILGIPKWDLIELYEDIGIPYLDMDISEVEKEETANCCN